MDDVKAVAEGSWDSSTLVRFQAAVMTGQLSSIHLSISIYLPLKFAIVVITSNVKAAGTPGMYETRRCWRNPG